MMEKYGTVCVKKGCCDLLRNVKKDLERILLQVQKPSRYTGGELGSVVKDPEKVDVRFAFCFPDVYEVGMSHLGMKILYALTNARENYWCERVFAPDQDMEQLMRERGIPLYGLESLDAIGEFDFIGFTLQYEMSFTAVLKISPIKSGPVVRRMAGKPLLRPRELNGPPSVIAMMPPFSTFLYSRSS